MPPRPSSGSSKSRWVEPKDLIEAVKLLGGTKSDIPRAVDSIRRLVASETALWRSRDDDPPGSWWIMILDGLFEAVLRERVAILKAEREARDKPSSQVTKKDARHPAAAAITRIEQLAETVRFIINQSYKTYTKVAFHKVYEHLLQTSTEKDCPFVHVCQPYIKALRTLLSFHAHVEHMTDNTWKALMMWCWSFLLGDKLDGDDGRHLMDEKQAMAIDSILEPYEESTRQARARAGVKGVAIDIFAIISLLLEAPTAPIVTSSSTSEDPETFGKPISTGACILSHITTYLDMYFSETGHHHLPLIRNANLILTELEFNSLSSVVDYGTKLLPHLVNLWATRKADLRQQLLIAFGILLPHLGRDSLWRQRVHEEEISDQLGKLLTILESDLAGPLSFSPLEMANLRLGLSNHDGPCPPLQYRVISAGAAFTEDMVMTWSSMELRGDVTKVLAHLTNARQEIELPPSRAAKRRRVEDVMQRLVGAIASASSDLLIALQTVTFFISRHWSEVGAANRADIRQRLVGLLGNNDHQVDSWAMICLAAMAAEPDTAQAQPDEAAEWDRLWQHATRRFILPGTCRAAALAMDVLLTCGKVSKAACRTDIENLLREIDLQGPSFPFDSVCAFLSTVLQYASSDVRLYRMDLGAKVLRWLASNWNVLHGTTSGFNIKARVEAHAPADVLRLLSQICRFQVILPLHLPTWEELLPDCPLAAWMLEAHRTGPIRRYFLLAELPEPDKAVNFPTEQVIPSSDLSLPRGITNQTILFLEKSCQALIDEWAMAPVLQTATPEKVRRTMDLAMLVAAFQAQLLFNGLHAAQQTTRLASELMSTVASCLNMTSFGAAGRALMWRGLSPILQSTAPSFAAWPGLILPTERSGIRRDILDPTRYRRRSPLAAKEETTLRMLQRGIWSLDGFVETLQDLARICRASLAAALDAEMADDDEAAASMDVDQDDFDPIQDNTAGVVQVASDRGHNDSALAVNRIWIQMLTVGPTIINVDKAPTRDIALLNAVINTQLDDFMSIAPLVVAAAGGGYLRIGTEAIEHFLGQFKDILGSYFYGRHQEAHLLVLDFLICTMPTWLQPAIIDSQLGELIARILRYYCDNMLPGGESMWRVRLGVVLVLEQYLEHDDTLQLWPELREMSEPHPAVETIMASGSDIDTRVRFQAASACALIIGLDLSNIDGSTSDSLYDAACATFTSSADEHEGFLTTLLFKINVCISSSSSRGKVLFQIYEVFNTSGSLVRGNGLKLPYALQCLHGLNSVARLLSLNALADLYLAYATDIIDRQGNRELKPLCVPLVLYGFEDRSTFAEAVLPVAGHVLLYLGDVKTFKEVCTAGQLVVTTAAEFLAPAVVAAGYASIYHPRVRSAQVEPEPDFIDSVLRAIYQGLSDARDPLDLARANFSTAIVSVIALMDGLEDMRSISRTLDASPLRPNVHVYDELLKPDATHGAIDSTILPSLPLETCLTIMSHLQRQLHAAPSAAQTVLMGLQSLSIKICCTPLVSEQRRGIRSAALLFALYHGNTDWSLIVTPALHCLLRLFEQADVAGSVLCMIRWVIKAAIGGSSSSWDLGDFFVQLGMRATRYTADPRPETQSTGRSAMQWLGHLITSHRDHFSLGKSLRRAEVFLGGGIPAAANPKLDDVIDILRDPMVDSNKLCLASSLQIASLQSPLDRSLFSSSLFWHLKSSLAAQAMVVDTDQLAFLDLLHRNGGQVDAPAQDSVPQHSSRLGSSAPLTLAIKKSDPELNAKACLVAIIHDVSRGSLPILAAKAQTSLSALVCSFPGALQSSSLSDVVKKELGQVRQATFLLSSDPTPELGVLRSEAWTAKASTFSVWVKDFAILCVDCLRRDDVFFDGLKDVLKSDTTTAAKVLPYLMHCLLLFDARKSGELTAKAALSLHFGQVLSAPPTHVDVLDTALEVIQHLRHFTPAGSADPEGHDTWLQVDYSLLSRCAVKCGKYATALLFAEKAQNENEQVDVAVLASRNEVLYAVYSNVEDPDGFYGVKSTDVKKSLIQRYHHEERWSQALEQHGAAFQTGIAALDTTRHVLTSLDALGFHRIASHIIAGLRSDGPQPTSEVDPLEYEVAWRNGNWDVPSAPVEVCNDSRQLLYSALRSVHRERDLQQTLGAVKNIIGVELRSLGRLGMESIVQTRGAVRTLLCLHEIFKCLDGQTTVDQGLNKRSEDSYCDFATSEMVLSARISVLQAFRLRASRTSLGTLGAAKGPLEAEKSAHLSISRDARREGKVQAAINAITAVQVIEGSQGSVASAASQDEYSQVLWAQGEYSLAIQLVTELCSSYDAMQPPIRARAGQAEEARLRARLANWTHSAKLEPPEAIRAHFKRASKLVEGSTDDMVLQAEICHAFAEFLDQQHNVLTKSAELQRLRSYRDRKKSQLLSLQQSVKKASRKSSMELQSVQESTAKELRADHEAVEDMERSTRYYLHQALKMYSKSLVIADTFNDSLIRLMTLWLEHSEDVTIHAFMADQLLIHIPSWKFVFLGPQLAARLSHLGPESTSKFQDILNSLMLRLSRDHPYQILYQVITLSRSHTISKKVAADAAGASRAEAAAAILARLATETNGGGRSIQQTAADMVVFASAAVKWCAYDVTEDPKNLRGDVTLPPQCPLLSLKRLSIPVATYAVQVDPSAKYRNVPTLQRYSAKFKVAGGLSRPTVLTCVDSNSQRHIQLFKRGDDVRKDAVMEQVFATVNDLLVRDKRAKDRHLRFRTYTVIPLAGRNGLIEFVGNSQAIGDWLVPAHKKYRKGDMLPEEFRKGIKELQDKDPFSSQIPKRWLSQIERFRPVMRHFFVERHKDPMAWHIMRLAYTRSVAVTSMVGHMVGLGDRHCSNILIDKISGELVHIDLGIAFEEGLDLRIPERVPFRLSNDIVDGLGISGVDGTFRRCSQETMRVLRECSSLIMTVLEVFKHDPLQAWTATPEKIAKLQAERGGMAEPGLAEAAYATAEKADRILARVAKKLQPDLSVEYTVNQLIQEARDPERLATIYTGWQSWL